MSSGEWSGGQAPRSILSAETKAPSDAEWVKCPWLVPRRIGYTLTKHFFVLLVGDVPSGVSLCSELCQFFLVRHAAPLPDLPLIPQLHSPSE